jgi:heptosyltransferase-1
LQIADRNFYASVRSSRKILAFALGGLGDVVHCVPALRSLRLGFPDAQIDVLASGGGVAFLQLVDGIDRLIPYSGRKTGWGRGELRQLWSLHREHYDLCLNFWGSNHASGAALATLAPVRLGRRPYETWKKAWRLCHTHIGIYPHLEEPMYLQWTGLLESLGFPVDRHFRLQSDPELLGQAGLDPTRRGRYIHVSPCASESAKELALPQLIEVLNGLGERCPAFPLVLTSTAAPRQRERMAALVAALRVPPLAICEGTLRTDALFSVIQGAALHVSSDTGTVHMAVAADTPSVTWFQKNPFIREYLPQGERHYAFITDERQPQGITTVAPAAIVEQCAAMLARTAPAPAAAALAR